MTINFESVEEPGPSTSDLRAPSHLMIDEVHTTLGQPAPDSQHPYADATNVQVQPDGSISLDNHGIHFEFDKDRNPVAARSHGFSFEQHQDTGKWYYHQDSGGDWVEIEPPIMCPRDGSIHSWETGNILGKRRHSLTADGQETEAWL